MAKAEVKCVNSAVHHFLLGRIPGGGGGAGTPIFSYMRSVGSFFWGSKFEFH